jgi:hypothetical protein
MKKYTIFAILIVLLIVSFENCKKSTPSPLPSYTMSATLTKSATPSLFSASGVYYVTAVDSGGECIISGSQTSGTSVVSNFTMAILNYTGAGTYVFDSNFVVGYYETIDSAFKQTAFVSGTLTIKNVSGENIYGSFSGTLRDSTTVTNGKFVALGNGF